MPIPASFIRDGFLPPSKARNYRRLLIGSDGPADTGKTEFACSAPGPGIVICLDRGADGMLENPNPPATRRDDFAFKLVSIPTATQSNDPAFYLTYWQNYYKDVLAALANPEAKTIVLDGDSDSWELQRLAAFGKLTQVPSIMYTNVNAARRAFINRMHDSNKVVFCTHKIKKHYVEEKDAQGNIKVGNDGKPLRTWDGTFERQGFDDQDYLFKLQLHHMFKPAHTKTAIVAGQPKMREVPAQWGVRVTKFKPNQDMVGLELWGDDCNFPSLMQNLYPEVDPAEWGL